MIPDSYKDRLQRIIDDDLLLKAIEAVFNDRIEQEKPQVNDGDDNSLLGEKYRAYERSKEIIKQGFADLMSYRISKNPIKNFNKGK